MKPSLSFEYLTPLKIEESSRGKAIVSGTLATTGISRNGNAYDLPTLRQVAESAVGKPLFYGTTTKPDPNTGILMHNMHDDVTENQIGKVTKTTFNKRTGLVKFLAEVWNTAKFPHVVSEISRGFGISLKGKASSVHYAVDKIRGMVAKIGNIIVESVQLLSPFSKRGIENAQIEDIKIQESMMIFRDNKNKFLTAKQIVSILISLGEI